MTTDSSKKKSKVDQNKRNETVSIKAKINRIENKDQWNQKLILYKTKNAKKPLAYLISKDWKKKQMSILRMVEVTSLQIVHMLKIYSGNILITLCQYIWQLR